MKQFDAIAFDVDGTLYPNYRVYLRLAPRVIKEFRLVNAFRKARVIIRKKDLPEKSFFDAQAEIIAGLLKADRVLVKAKIENLIYRDWCEVFNNIKPFKDVRQTLEAFRQAGYKTAAMSDFPPHEKLNKLKLGGIWDAIIGSEFTGRLKPDPRPFLRLAEALHCPCEKILYVGNSVYHDIVGAKKTGMKAALIEPVPRWRYKGGADFVFRTYRQLREFVLNNKEEI